MQRLGQLHRQLHHATCVRTLLVAAIDGALLWDVVHHIPSDDGLDALGVMLTFLWFMIAAWAIMTWRNNRRDDRHGGRAPSDDPSTPPR